MGTNGRKVLTDYSADDSSDEDLLDIGHPAPNINDDRMKGTLFSSALDHIWLIMYLQYLRVSR